MSTDKQGRSDLGLDAQKEAVKRRLDGGSWKLVAAFTEIESGRRKTRPELAKALAACKAHKAKLVVAKPDCPATSSVEEAAFNALHSCRWSDEYGPPVGHVLRWRAQSERTILPKCALARMCAKAVSASVNE